MLNDPRLNDSDLRMIAAAFAESVLYLYTGTSTAPAEAIRVARLYAMGEATEAELRDAAWSAAATASATAAWSAAWSAATAAWSAAWSAATWSAATWPTASATATAAWSATASATATAAWSATAYTAEREKQVRIISIYLDSKASKITEILNTEFYCAEKDENTSVLGYILEWLRCAWGYPAVIGPSMFDLDFVEALWVAGVIEKEDNREKIAEKIFELLRMMIDII